MKELRTYASVQLIGEYGVYANGRMVQLMLPLSARMRLIPSDSAGDKDSALNDPPAIVRAEHSGEVYSDAQQKRLEDRLARRVGMIARWLRGRNLGPRAGGVEFCTDFPLGLGIEDNLSVLTHWCLGSECSLQEAAERVVECEWEDRPTCSFVYLLPAIKLAGAGGAAPSNVFLLERDMPTFESWAEFGEMKNCPAKIRPAWRWVEHAVSLRLAGIQSGGATGEGVVFDIALFARPKAALPDILHPSVKEAVTSLPLPRSRRFLQNLGNLTDQAFVILSELADLLRQPTFEKDAVLNLWWELGRILTCYHFTMSAIQRTDPLSDKFVLEVTQRTDVVGAKTTASGLGGTVLVLYFSERGQEQNALKEMQSLAERYGYTRLSGAVLRSFCAIL